MSEKRLLEFLRRVLVVVVAGPPLLVFGSLWFMMAFPIAYLQCLMERDKPWWLWKYSWSFSTYPFFGFWCLLTGYEPSKSEFWR